METQSVSGTQPVSNVGQTSATQGLGSDDFFDLLIAQLMNQDPMEPTSNEELLNQISAIRDIELTSNLSESLTSLTSQQRFASAASLIGQHVSGKRSDGVTIAGVVEAVRFDSSGKAQLELEDGSRISLDDVELVANGERSADSLVGKFVTGVDRSDPGNLRVIEGVVTGSAMDASGLIALELDTGQSLRMQDVIDVQGAAASTEN
jgi:flagellar basal-body rod modification protein FlgD